ncbi:protocatechuate 3,4-dioxygenase subunit alpha [Allomuricauda sp. NBRC 101325]|uniref:protocatechuate 3,4-dioxygenase subunit alpha n=1 Tax=Allomuricauda sp. NBRC 101325 TaxID=1113758 RepID=UPI0024A41B1B|nr:protocatechuate 3,4-dioxygenase subunit alpha [Muricauda sp. NBRC 101325]GLU43941.1 protocatechuate 3,4-dioxygenase subunit alpha [Muricauda sp. NBRC 101325]
MKQTPSQTVGPYFAYGLTPQQYNYDFPSHVDGNMVDPLTTPNTITIIGQVLDGEGKPIDDAMIEVWQNDGEKALFGRYGTGTDPNNRFIFNTIKPKSVNGQAPYVTFVVFMRGQLIHSFTRMYFSDETSLNKTDETLNSIPEHRRNTLIAKQNGNQYQFDIHMQGDLETVFFDI